MANLNDNTERNIRLVIVRLFYTFRHIHYLPAVVEYRYQQWGGGDHKNRRCIRASTVSQNSVLYPPFLPSHNAFIWCESARAIVEPAISNTTGEFCVAESYHLNPPSIYIDVMLITAIFGIIISDYFFIWNRLLCRRISLLMMTGANCDISNGGSDPCFAAIQISSHSSLTKDRVFSSR